MYMEELTEIGKLPRFVTCLGNLPRKSRDMGVGM